MKKWLSLAVCALAAAPLVSAAPAVAMPVFDSANYSQNLLSAARALKQIDQQIQQLQNEARVLANMDKHLKRVDFPELERLKANLGKVEELMGEADAIDFGVDRLDAKLAALFPKDFAGRTRTARVADAKARLDAAMGAYRRTLGVQSRIVANVSEDAQVLADLSERSNGAEGSLQVAQVTNQILTLASKQQMQLQQMMAAQFQAEALERADAAQAAAEARERTRRFLGDGKAYTPKRN